MPEKSTAGHELVRHCPALVSRTKLKRVSRAVGQAGTYFEPRDTGMGSQGRYVDGNWGKRDTIVGQAVGIGKGQSQLNILDLTGSFFRYFFHRL
jgi:hypothetical protein